ncbi:uncharacterized protein V6R79_003229 [Siganus canaliculatus]
MDEPGGDEPKSLAPQPGRALHRSHVNGNGMTYFLIQLPAFYVTDLLTGCLGLKGMLGRRLAPEELDGSGRRLYVGLRGGALSLKPAALSSYVAVQSEESSDQTGRSITDSRSCKCRKKR